MTGPGLPGQDALADRTGLVVPRAPGSVALVRRYAADACEALGWGGSADTVTLLVSEVVTHAVLHSYDAHVRVRVLEDGLRLRVEVFDGSPALPAPRGAPPGDESGRGLVLVEALAVAWGTDTRSGGTTTWFEIGL